MPFLNSLREYACFNALGSLFHARQALKTKSFVLAIFDDGSVNEVPNRSELENPLSTKTSFINSGFRRLTDL